MEGQFNTGRHYSEHGQRIVWKLSDGKIVFNDLDRGLWYSCPAPAYDINIQNWIMSYYDENKCSNDCTFDDVVDLVWKE